MTLHQLSSSCLPSPWRLLTHPRSPLSVGTRRTGPVCQAHEKNSHPTMQNQNQLMQSWSGKGPFQLKVPFNRCIPLRWYHCALTRGFGIQTGEWETNLSYLVLQGLSFVVWLAPSVGTEHFCMINMCGITWLISPYFSKDPICGSQPATSPSALYADGRQESCKTLAHYSM